MGSWLSSTDSHQIASKPTYTPFLQDPGPLLGLSFLDLWLYNPSFKGTRKHNRCIAFGKSKPSSGKPQLNRWGLGCCHLLNNHLAKPSSIKGVQVLGHIGDKARRKAGLLSSNRSHCLCNQTTFVISLHVMISTRKDHEGLCQWLATDMTVGQLDSEFLPYFWSCHIQETLLPPSQCS